MTKNSLISSIGPIRQLAFTPKDFDAAVRYWTQTMGIGPFFYIENAPVSNVKFRGEPSNVKFGLAIAYWGDMQIELVRQHNDAPSIYTEMPWCRTNGALHHVCLFTDDINKAISAVHDGDGEVIVSLDLMGGGKAIYADMGGGEGLVEICEVSPQGMAGFEKMRQAAIDWDGKTALIPV